MIVQYLSWIVGVVGLGLVSAMGVMVMQLRKAVSIARHRSQSPGVADLLNYAAMVDDGILLCKNGSLMAAWMYQGDDNASATDDERNALSLRINQAINRLGNGWMMHVDAVRRHAPDYPQRELSSFPDPVSYAIDEERRRLFERLGAMYEGYFVLVLTWFPPVIAQQKLGEMVFEDESRVELNDMEKTLKLIEQFKREIEGIENKLTLAVKMKRLKSREVVQEDDSTIVVDDFLGWLNFCITGKHHPVNLPKNPMYLDKVLGGQELWAGTIPKVGSKFVQVVGIDGFPMESTPGMLSALAELQCEYRWSTRFIFLDQSEAMKRLDGFRKKWRQKVRGILSEMFNIGKEKIDLDALAMVHDADQAMAEVSSGLVAAGYYTSNVVIYSEKRDELEWASRYIEKEINRLGFTARIETVNTMDAFVGTLPGHGVENVRRPLMHTMNCADLLPVSTIWAGEYEAPCPMYPPMSPALMHCVTHGATPFRLNLHVRDLGHTFMFGPTGAGKSTHLAIIAAQLRRYKGMTLYCFDKGMSMYPLTMACNGLHFSVASDDDALAFCPLQFLESKSDQAWAMEWIDTILALNGINTTPTQRNEIGNAIMSMRASGARTLSEFSLTIQDEGIREALRQYTVDGSMGHLLDAEDDGLALTDFTTFEIEDLMNLGDKYALPVLLYIFRRIERNLKGQPAVIILDEAWLMLGHPVFRAKIREWLKVMRKANCTILMATQSLSDAANSGILDVIVESTATKIFLPNVFARDEDTSALYKRMGLNTRQIEILASGVPKRQYYYTSEKGRRLYDLALGPLSLAFVGASDKDSVATIKSMVARYGDNWVHEWLKTRGLRLDNYLRDADMDEAA
jgi:type IV secretion system protein VirB4